MGTCCPLLSVNVVGLCVLLFSFAVTHVASLHLFHVISALVTTFRYHFCARLHHRGIISIMT